MQDIKAAYPMRQIDLYTIARMVWHSTGTFLSDFTDYRTTYDAPLVALQLAAINSAQALPDFQARNAAAETKRNELEQTIKPPILNAWQKLKRYISYTTPEMDQKAEWESAGYNYYPEAAASNWDALAQLCQSAQNYLTSNLLALTTAGMPATFQTQFDTLATQFTVAHEAFLTLRQSAYIATEQKIKANNQVYQALSNVVADAKLIFIESPATLKQFTIADLTDMITGAGASGIKGKAIDPATGKTLPGATIEVVETGDIVTTDADGNYELRLPSGTYNIVAQYEPTTAQPVLRLKTEIKVIKGTISNKTFELISSLEEDA
jgi:hypothetical protein